MKTGYIAYIAATAAALAWQSQAATCTWINEETATAQSWTVASNWQDGVVPSAGDDVQAAASAAIDFSGADVGSVTCAGTLVIDCGGGTMTNRGDVTATSISLKNAYVYLPEGDHVWTHSGDFLFTSSSTASANAWFIGEGSFTKAGAGTMKSSGTTTNYGLFKNTGTITIKGGGFEVQPYGADTFRGPTEIVVDGITSVLYMRRDNYSWDSARKFGTVYTLRLNNKGRIYLHGEGNNTAVHKMTRLFIDDKECAAGSWGAWNSTVVDYKSLRIYADAGKENLCQLTVTEDPENPYRAEDFVLSSGDTRVWTGAAGTSAWATRGNWQDGIAPRLFDDVHVPAEVTTAPKISGNNNYYHSILIESPVSMDGRLYLSGDYSVSGVTSTITVYSQLTFLSGDHVMDVSAPVNVTWHNSVTPGPFIVEGSLTKRGAGKLTLKTNSGSVNAAVPVGGTLSVEGGELCLDVAASELQCTNVVVSGEGSVLTVKGAGIDTNAVVSVSDGGKLKLDGSFTQKVRSFVKDGSARRAGRTYGSTSSGAASLDGEAFSGAGMLEPWFKSTLGFMLILK